MSNKRTISYYDKISPHIKPHFSSVLDIGCDEGHALFEFEKNGFGRLVGIDSDVAGKNLGKLIFGIYCRYKDEQGELKTENPEKKNFVLKDLEVKDLPILPQIFPKLHSSFQTKYDFHLGPSTGDFQRVNLGGEKFDVILLADILHFFDMETASFFLYMCQESLNDDGLLFLKVNNVNNQDIIAQASRKIDYYTYEGKYSGIHDPGRGKEIDVKYHLLDEERLSSIMMGFREIERFESMPGTWEIVYKKVKKKS